MTRTVSKILATIAMVVVLPLMVVGTAFVAFFSTDKTVNVSAVIFGDPAVGVKAPEVEFNGKTNKSHKITTGLNRTVEVLAQKDPTGYTFEGWFAGSEVEYKAAVAAEEEIQWAADATSPKLTIKMDESVEEYVAVYTAVRYEIAGWSYSLDPDNDGAAVTTAPQGAKETYIYGEALPVEDDLVGKQTITQHLFAGWKVQNGTGERYTHATFSKDEGAGKLTLIDPWEKVGQSTIKYFDEDGAELESKAVAAGKEYDLDDARTKAKSPVDGYEYSWGSSKQTNDHVTMTGKLEANTTYSYYLHAEAIEYTVAYTVTSESGNAKATSKIGETVTFKLGPDSKNPYKGAELTALTNFLAEENWTLGRIYHEFGGLSLESTTYKDAETLAKAIVEKHKTEKATETLTLSVIENYSMFSVTNPVSYLAGQKGYAEASEEVWEPAQGGTNERVVSPRSLENKETETYTMAELLGLANIENGTWYAKVSKDGTTEKRKLELRELSVVIGTQTVFYARETFDFNSIKNLTFAQFIDVVLKNGSNFEDSGLKAEIENADLKQVMQIANISVKYNITDTVI